LTANDLVMRDPRDALGFVFHETAIRKLTVGVMGLILKIFMEMRVEGLDHLPQEGACILVANHLTNLDVFPMQLALTRPLFFMAKSELFTHKLMGWFIRQLGAFPVQRGASDQWALAHSRKLLDHGLVLAIFPEGTRSRGGLSVAKTGAARLAIEKNVPIVPLAISGTQCLFKKFPHRAEVHINISAPVLPEPDADPISLTDQFMFTLASNLPAELRGAYAARPRGFDL